MNAEGTQAECKHGSMDLVQTELGETQDEDLIRQDSQEGDCTKHELILM